MIRNLDGKLIEIKPRKFNWDVHFSSATEEWETPQDFFDKLDEEFHFTLDPCATPENAKCERYYTKKENGLHQSWTGEIVFMNPPYGQKIAKWVRKAYYSSLKPNTTVVCLIPARTDTRWFHNYCLRGEIRFIKGRLKFQNRSLPSWREDGAHKVSPAPFPSMIVIFPENRL